VAREQRTYTDEDRAATLAALVANGGNVAKTARECGVKRQTLQHWIRQQQPRQVPTVPTEPGIPLAPEKKQAAPVSVRPTAERVAALVPGAVNVLADNFQALAEKLVGVADRGADKLNAKDAVISAGVAVDKMRLLREQATVILDHRPDLSKLTDEQLDTLDTLAALALGR
jgi:transposase-like protein